MTSFINLMANDNWSEADIINRTEALIASEFPPAAAAILNRKSVGAALGQYALTAAEMQELGRYAYISNAAREAGDAARLDAALLRDVLPVEAAHRRLALEAVLPITEVITDPETQIDTTLTTNQVEIDKDTAERADAQAIVDAATAAVNALYLQRNPPPPEPVAEPTPDTVIAP